MFTVVTDSSAYFTRREAAQFGVHVLPLLYSVGGISFIEGHVDENGRYKELLAQSAGQQRTAQVSVSTFLGAFSELLRKGNDVLCITMSSRLSGTYSSALAAAREVDPVRIMVVDSLSTVGGLRFLAEAAVRLSLVNKTLRQTADALEQMRETVGIALSVDDMGALRRSGRLGFVRQSVGTVLNMRPILFCKNGTVIASGVARGSHGQIAELVRSIPPGAKRIIVHHIARRSHAEALQRAVMARFPFDVGIAEVGPVLAIHLGLSAIGVAWHC